MFFATYELCLLDSCPIMRKRQKIISEEAQRRRERRRGHGTRSRENGDTETRNRARETRRRGRGDKIDPLNRCWLRIYLAPVSLYPVSSLRVSASPRLASPRSVSASPCLRVSLSSPSPRSGLTYCYGLIWGSQQRRSSFNRPKAFAAGITHRSRAEPGRRATRRDQAEGSYNHLVRPLKHCVPRTRVGATRMVFASRQSGHSA